MSDVWPEIERAAGSGSASGSASGSPSGPLAVPEGFRSGFVALVGRPNVGKSTLVNAILGRKVSITAEKPQTTRHRVAGVVSGSDHQLVLLDIPGFQKPRDALTRRMQDLVDSTVGEADAALFVLDAGSPLGRGDRFIAKVLAGSDTPVIVALNKCDLDVVEGLSAEIEAMVPGAHIARVSALCGTGVPELVERLVGLLREGPRYFPEGVVTDQPEEILIAEFVREKLIGLTEEELPHALAVEVVELEPREGGALTYVRAAVYVERDSQRPIVLGKAGSLMKRVGVEARPEIEWLLGTRVYLDLVVKVRKHWRKDSRMLDNLGL